MAEDSDRLCFLRNFCIKSEDEVIEISIDGKMNEVQAAIGLLNLPDVQEERRKRSALRALYDEGLEGLPGLQVQVHQPGVISSKQYNPLVIYEERFGSSRDDIYDALKTRNNFARKCFHPIYTDSILTAASPSKLRAIAPLPRG